MVRASIGEQILSLDRRRILSGSAIGIIAYSIVVLIYSNLIPQLRIQVFEGEILGVTETEIVGESPEVGDHLLSIAGVAIDLLPRYINTIQNLRNDGQIPAASVDSIEELAATNAGVVRMGDQRLARVRFVRPSEGDSVKEGWLPVRDQPWQKSAISIAWFAMESLIFWMGWVVFRRRPEDDAAAVFFLMCIVTVGAYMGGYHWLEIASNPALTFVFALCAMALPQVGLHFFLIFPEPKRFVREHPKVTVVFLYLVPAVLQIGVLWTIGSVVSRYRHAFPDASIDWYVSLLMALVWIYLGLAALMFLGCVASLIHASWTIRQGVQKNQVRWLLGGALLAGFFVAYSLYLALATPRAFAVGAATWSMFAASLVFIFSHAVSIAKYRLLQMDEIVQRGFWYLAISFAGGLLYYGLLLLAIWYSPRLAADSPQGQALLISTFIILVLLALSSVRSRMQKLVDRRFFREKRQLERAIQRMDMVVGRLVDRDTVARRSLLVACDLLNCQVAAVYLRDWDDRSASLDGVGDRAGGSWGTAVKRTATFRLADQIGPRKFPAKLPVHHPLVLALGKQSLVQANPGLVLPGDPQTPLLRRLGVEVAQAFVWDGSLIGFLLVGAKESGIHGSEELEFLSGFAALATMALGSAEAQRTLERLNDDLRGKAARVARNQKQLLALEARTEPLFGDAEDPKSPRRSRSLRGHSPPMQLMADTVRKVAASSATVLIRGESGTGKSLLAEVIHRHSARAGGPFVEVHCAALSPGLLESELFGHVKGAFTGADRDKVGRFQLAHGGTLFLDEIGDLGLEIQTKLLRVLQERTFEPVGSSQSATVDVRLITATHQPLEELVRRGRLREDLYYRLNVISVEMPPLRERRDDIPELALHFLRECALRCNKKVEGIDDEAFDLLMTHPWPGNIRQLENVIERAVVMADGALIGATDLPAELVEWRPEGDLLEPWGGGAPRGPRTAPIDREGAMALAGPLTCELDALERQRLLDALASRGGNKSKAAELLGIPRSTFCSKLKKFGIA